MIEKAIKAAEKEYGNESEEVAGVLLDTVKFASEFTKTQKRIERAEKIYESTKNTLGIARVNYSYGVLYSKAGGKAAARDYYEKALEDCDLVEEDSNELRYDILYSLALSYGYSEKGLEVLKRAEEVYRKLSAERQEELQILLYSKIGHTYYKLNDFENAIKYYDIVINNSIETSQDIAESYHYRGYSYSMLNNNQNAINDINIAIQMLDNMEGASLWIKATTYCHLALVYTSIDVQDYDKVLEYGLESCRIYNEKSELSVTELEELKLYKDILKKFYEQSPIAYEQDFEVWYRENIKQ